MGKEDKGIKRSDLRRRAEKSLDAPAHGGAALSTMPPDKTADLIHELRVHQVELEMQNEELRRVQGELEAARDRYAHLYDFAPVGYLTITEEGMIAQANLTAAAMLQRGRADLISRPFTRFIAREDQDIFYLHRQQLLEGDGPRSCRLRLVKNDGGWFFAQLECLAVQAASEPLRQFRVSVIDINARQQAEDALQRAHDTLEQRVNERTADLLAANKQLAREIAGRKQSEAHIRDLSQKLLRTQEQERKAIAYELHDNIAQNFALIKLIGAQLFQPEPMPLEEAKARRAEFMKLIDSAIDEVRNLAAALRPDLLDQMGLAKALEIHCQKVSRRHGLEIDFQSAGIQGLDRDPEIPIQIYRLVQEGLSNICKHAGAGRARIKIAAAGPDIILRIEDNGKGFDIRTRQIDSNQESRMGLQSMRERVKLLQGRMEIRSRQKHGTQIMITIPRANQS